MKRKQPPCIDYPGIARKIRRGAYHTRRRLRRAVSRFHRAHHAEFALVEAPKIRAWLAGREVAS